MSLVVTHDDSYGCMDWDSNTVVTANGLHKTYSTFNFIYSFIVTMHCMSVIKPLSIKLQYRANDIAYAYSKIQDVIKELEALRTNDSVLHDWYVQAESIAADIDVEPDVPRTVSRQLGRDNVEHASPEEYYRRSIALPLLDHLIQQMKERFGDSQVFASKLLHLIPSILCRDASISFSDVIKFYTDDLPNPAVVDTEIFRWKMKWLALCRNSDSCPSTLLDTLLKCDKDFFPNIHCLLHIACTLPVTSCECERANSTLKRVKTSLRSTMGQERLSALALMSVHRSMPIDFDDVVDRFKILYKRRVSL